MLKLATLAIVIVCIPLNHGNPTQEDQPSPPKQDSEWKNIETKDVVGGLHKGQIKTITGTVYRPERKDSMTYSFPMSVYQVVGTEQNGSNELTMKITGPSEKETKASLTMERSDKAKTTNQIVNLGGPVTYFDLDGDGVIDCWTDNRAGTLTPFILFEGRVIQVENSLNPFKKFGDLKMMAWGIGRNENYEFTKGKWTSVKQ